MQTVDSGEADRLGGRLALLSRENLDEAQQQVYEALTRLVVPEAAEGGFTARLDDGRFIGPFNALLRVPQIAAGMGQWAGQIGRFEIAEDVRQVVILTVGAAWSAEYEIDAHRSAARIAGVAATAIEAIVEGRRPTGLGVEADVAYRLTAALLTEHVVSDALYAEAISAFGEAGVIAILCLIGQYQTISSILVCFQVPVPTRSDLEPERGSRSRAGTNVEGDNRQVAITIIAPEYGEIDTLVVRRGELPEPGRGQVSIAVRAAGVNPADWKGVHRSWPRSAPMAIGFEAAGVVTALGAGVDSIAIGEAVIAYPISGAYASDIVVPMDDVFLKPITLDFPQAANLLLVGTTAAELLEVSGVSSGETVIVHGGSSATGVSLLQQLAPKDVRVLATSGERNFDLVRSFGAEPVSYGPGLGQRLRDAVPEGIDAALDCVGTDEAIDVSLDLVSDRTRIVSIAARERAPALGIQFIDGMVPKSLAYRNAQRDRLIEMAAADELSVPVARTLPLTSAQEAFAILQAQHPGGKLALIP